MKRKKKIKGEEEYIPKAFKNEKNKENIEEIPTRKHKTKGKRKKLKKDIDNTIQEKKKKKSKLKRRILLIIVLIIVFLGIKIGISTNKWKMLANEMIKNENSILKDTDDKTIANLGSERKNENISFSSMPDNLKNAYVAIEDERFYKHHGVDMKRTSSAIASYIIHFGSSSFGGSTITQQLVKNLTGDSTDSISRKINEWWKAWTLETSLNKDEILEAYLNVIYVGPNTYGVEAGAKYYFNKTAKDLSLEEMAFLAGINHSPNSYNPFENKDNSEKIKTRTKTVLAKMVELKYISQEDYNTAIAKVDSGLKFNKGAVNSSDGIYSYHTDALISEVVSDISKKYKISETFANNYMNMAGLTIYSNQDTSIQTKLENEFEKTKYSLASKNGNDSSQAAMVIIDHKTGYVTGCTGGLGKKTKARSLNRATQSIRQTGSSIKPISVLVPAIDKRIITASTILNDTRREFEKGFNPDDYSNQLGEVTVRRAVESSQNIPFVEIMEKLKPKTAIKYLEKMGISTLTEEDNNLVLSLGGLQRGISPLEMAGAYATIANDGVYIEPTFYNKINNSSGKTIITPKQKKRRVCSKDVAYIVKELLTQPVKGENGTATYCNIKGMDVAAKTGTTDENYDRWLCGFTPYYTAVTWYGYDINESINYYGKNPAGLIWANVMNSVHANLKNANFEKTNGVKTVTVCSETGEKATTGCPNTYEEYFLLWTEPKTCHKHSGREITNNQNTTKSNQTKTDTPKGPTLEEEERIDNVNNNTNSNTTNNTVKNNTVSNNETNSRSNTINNTNSTNTNTNTSNTTPVNTTTTNKTSTNSTSRETTSTENVPEE